ncbi:hypothetical protein [Caminicella sporogenes]|uniref:hypothetical protein n=1 Tax=Caminicella sporogenes TaxID=166485 RepID=UPI002540E247|nr:hypothetical protein [Caminicella sporogenes]WIF94295.1 hypothetical protein QNI18_08360 [Caminicella sporogenes]
MLKVNIKSVVNVGKLNLLMRDILDIIQKLKIICKVYANNVIRLGKVKENLLSNRTFPTSIYERKRKKFVKIFSKKDVLY